MPTSPPFRCPDSDDEVLRFISFFQPDRRIFLDGLCYYFSVILQERFGGIIYYAMTDGHFVTQICDRLYDISGDVTDAVIHQPLIPWDAMEAYDPLVYQRILRDCVRKDTFTA